MVKSDTSIPKDIDWRILSWGVLSPSLHLPLAHLLNKISPNKEMQSSSTEYNKKNLKLVTQVTRNLAQPPRAQPTPAFIIEIQS